MASSSCLVTRLDGLDRVITKLTRGREIADRLRLMFDGSSESDSVLSAQKLVTLIVDSFTESLSILRESGEVVNSAADKSEDSGHSYKRKPVNDRRGRYKKKKSLDSLVKETPNLVEDGHQWRKYGQKIILNTKHPRNYFRCTHKFEQGCQATKQVQKVNDNPPLFRTTYHGQHTCKKSATHHRIIMDAIAAAPDSSIIWSFGSNPNDDSGLLIDSARDYHVASEFDSSTLEDLAAFSPISCTASTRSIDDMVGSIEDFFEFEP